MISKQKKLLLLGLSLSMYACPDTTAGDQAGTEAGGGLDIAGDMLSGTEAGFMGGMSLGGPCSSDSDCPDGNYCFSDESFNSYCVEGCAEDGCDGGRVCDLDSRECVFPPCEADSDCPEGTYCNEAVCETGCRLDEACPGDNYDEDGRAILCDPLTHECVSHSPCCVEADGEESCVAATVDQCSALDGQRIENSLLCDDNPCGQRCEIDVDCRILDSNGATFYCDPVDQRCGEGCREGECAGDLVCNTQTRLCSPQDCVSSADCAEGQFCNPVDLICQSGCGSNDDCDDGFVCASNVCLESCSDNASCGENRYCDTNTQACRDECASHDDCNDNEACNPVNAQCQIGLCRDDEALGELNGEPNSTFAEASRLNLVPLASNPEYSSARAESRIICGGDLDIYRIGLDQGERMRITLSHEGGGDLNMRIFSSSDTSIPLVETNSLEIPEVLEFPGETEVRAADDYYIEVSGMLDDNARLGYNLSIQTAPLGNACFFDDRESEEGDNEPEEATALIADEISTFDDGTICVGDEDWFSIPLTVNDGLEIELRTTIAAQALRFDLYSSSELNAIGGNPSPTFSVNLESSIEDPASGDRIYSLNIPFNSASFEDGVWYLKVSGDDPSNSYANYRLNIDHDASALVCVADQYEPNNTFGQGVDLVSALMLPVDDQGFLAQGQDNRVQAVSLCSGDQDYYCFDLDNGDQIEAWLISNDTIGSGLEISFVDSSAGQVGTEARHTINGEEFDIATFRGALAGRYCAVINGLGNSQGSYELNVRRTVIEGGACASDELDGDNNIADRSTALNDISEDQGLRFEQRNGLMCGGNDVADWYNFPVANDGSTVCVMLDGFEHDTALGGLDLEFYETPIESGTACTSDANCQGIQADACIDGYCQVTSARSRTQANFEMLQFPTTLVSSGDHYIKVNTDGNASSLPYDLRVTVTPGRDVCQPDWQEIGDPNDDSSFNGYNPSRATALGSGAVGLCDAWICSNPNGADDEDWYKVTVPAQEDRTIVINFGSNSDGHLDLLFFGETQSSQGQAQGVYSATPSYNYQCINIQGGLVDNEIEMGILSSFGFVDDGNQRIDYSLKVIPTDLSVNPNGACSLVASDDGITGFDPCTSEEVFTFTDPETNETISIVEGCWPTVNLP